jgi:cell shape-determining protein MreC
MKSLRVFFVGIGALAVIALVVVYRGALSGALRDGRGLLLGLFDSKFSYSTFQSLRTENAELRSRLSLIAESGSQLSFPSFTYELVAVYAQYPLNDRERIIIDRGSDGGLTAGTPVFVAPNVLFGRVTRVDRTRAEVETIFDPAWKSSVTIGTSSARAVLSGGNPLRLTLIAEDAQVAVGDSVTNVAPEYPLGATIGSIRAVTADANDAWRTATLDVPYSTELLTHVLVPRNFP